MDVQSGCTRRSLLRAGAAAGVAAALPAPALARRVEGGAALPEIPDLPLERDGKTASGRLTAGPVEVDVAGRPVALQGYAGRFPGPVIRLRHDETLALDFENRLDEATNLHTHGLSVTPGDDGDNPFRRIAPGAVLRYRLPLRGDPVNGGLHWYHPHLHGLQAAQLFSGLAGPIVVDGPEDPGAMLGTHEERILVLKDLRLGPDGLQYHRATDWLMGLEGEALLVNGAVRPLLRARERRLRLRVVNAGNARYWRLVARPAAPFQVLALDGRTLGRPVRTGELLLAPAQRIDAVLDLRGDEPVEIFDLPVPRRAGYARRPEPVLTIQPPAGRRAVPDPLPERLVERPAFDPAVGIAARREVVFSLFYINGVLHRGDVHGGHAPMFRPRFDTREVWDIRNVDTMDHPFHLHTWPFRVLEDNGRAVPGQPFRDTLSLRSGETARIGIDFRGVAGRSVFHCHIVEHAAKGMMAVLEVSP